MQKKTGIQDMKTKRLGWIIIYLTAVFFYIIHIAPPVQQTLLDYHTLVPMECQSGLVLCQPKCVDYPHTLEKERAKLLHLVKK